MLRRYTVSWPAAALLIAIVIVAASRCGSAKKDKTTKTPPVNSTSLTAPADWDGKTDWDGSAWEVVEE